MSKKTIEIVLAGGEGIVRRQITEDVVELTDSLVEAFASSVQRKQRNVFEIGGVGKVHVTLSSGGSYYSLLLPQLPLRTNYKVEGGIAYPKFTAHNEPVLPISWKPPQNMRLLFLVLMTGTADGVQLANQWVIAVDDENRAWRLPLGNLHDDGRLCHGTMKYEHPTAASAMAASLEQLEKGRWQGDLDRDPDSTEKLFRFKPVNEGFEQQPFGAESWQGLCRKIAPAAYNFALL